MGSLEKLDQHYDTYRKASRYDDYMRFYTFQTLKPFLVNKESNALEFGCSDGQMTKMISECVKELDVVDGAERFLEEAKKRNIKNAIYTHSLFENFETSKRYDYIFATYIITHIEELQLFFNKVKSLLNENGLLFVAVPNSRVLSRQLALQMGMLKDLYLLSPNDISHGHCRAYDRVKLNADLVTNGFDIISQGGIILKPLADFQMDKLIDTEILKKEQMEGLYKLGMEFPDLSGAIYAVCKKKKE